MNEKTAILFDFDGTVMDTEPVILETFRYMFQKYAKIEDFTKEKEIEVLGSTLSEMLKRFFPSLNTSLLMKDYRNYQERIVDEFVDVMPHAPEVLKWLKERNYHLGLVSSRYHKSMIDILERKKMKNNFEIFIGQDDVLNSKPNPEGIQKACQILGLEKCVYIGDSDTDVVAGQLANTKTIAFVSNKYKERSLIDAKPDYLIYDFIDIIKIIGEMEKQDGNYKI